MKYDYYEEWMLHLKEGDKLIRIKDNKTEIKIFHDYFNATTKPITPPQIGQALFFTTYNDNAGYNLNSWKPLNREEKLKRILK